MSFFRKIPWWAWVIILALSITQPLLLVWIRYAPPEGLVPTGLHIPDSALFLYSMRMFSNGFESAYATCQSAHGLRGIEFYSVPHLWLYGVLGAVAKAFHADPFLAYGIANGLGAFCYLLAVCAFLHEAAPKQARLAFALFSLSGGLGGVLYLATGFLGLHNAGGFEDIFRRYAVYELFEGPHLLPVLLFPRFYYTVSLALCVAALTAFIRGVQSGNDRNFIWTTLLLPLGVFIDMRFGAFTLGIALLFLMSQGGKPFGERLNHAVAFAVRFFLGALPALALMRLNPAVIVNHLEVTNMAMWFSPFVSAALFHLLLLPGELRARLPDLPWCARVLALAAIGYLAAFTVLFLGYQAYYGNLLVARDAAVANAVSDWALLGGLFGGLHALRHPRPGTVTVLPSGLLAPPSGTDRQKTGDCPRSWIPLWFLIYLVLAISAFGEGWILRFGPQRIEVFLWLPLCLLSASALQRLSEREPRSSRVLGGVMICCGLCSIGVSLLCFQGPLGFRPTVSPFAANHAEVMTLADDHMMDRLGAGIVLAPIPASDIIVLRRGNRTVFGTGSFNLSDQPYAPLDAAVGRFFSRGASDEYRRRFVEDWCVEYIYCPDTWPVDAEVVERLRRAPWLEEVAAQGKAVLFKVAGDHVILASSQ
jgi:hypothetical protein